MPTAPQAPSVAQARQFIQQAGDLVTGLLNEPGDWTSKQRRLQALISGTMDVHGIARFALGRFWHLATGVQREEFVRLFPVVLLGQLGRVIGVFQGITFSIDRSIPHETWVEVCTTVYRPGIAPRQVVWLVGLPDLRLRIIDILAEGSSLRITQREDVTSFLAQHDHSIEQLLDALRRKIAEG